MYTETTCAKYTRQAYQYLSNGLSTHGISMRVHYICWSQKCSHLLQVRRKTNAFKHADNGENLCLRANKRFNLLSIETKAGISSFQTFELFQLPFEMHIAYEMKFTREMLNNRHKFGFVIAKTVQI